MNLPALLRTAVTGAILCSSAMVASAVVIPLSGGDAGEGYSPLGTVVAAEDFGGDGGQTVQGVFFAGSSPRITLSSVSSQPNVFNVAPFTSTTANDAALFEVGRNTIFNNPGPITLTISGLNVGESYQVDSFIGLSANFVERTMSVTANGFSSLVDSQLIGNGTLYDVRQTLLPNSSGQIILTYAVTEGFPAPNLNAISITSASSAVPEPTTALFGIALAGVCAIARRRRRVTA